MPSKAALQKEAAAKQKELAKQQREEERQARAEQRAKKAQGGGIIEDFIKQVGKTTQRQITNKVGRSITRTIFGTFFGMK